MNNKSFLTLLFVYVGLCGMDKPSYPWLEFVQAKCADNPAHARQPQNQAAALDSHAPQNLKATIRKESERPNFHMNALNVKRISPGSMSSENTFWGNIQLIGHMHATHLAVHTKLHISIASRFTFPVNISRIAQRH